MQIDFHHGTTYVIARLSGFSHPESEIIAYASQYVDDSTTSGFIRFENGMRFSRHATAHPVIDANNLDNDENSLSWLPFHFLPGGGPGAEDYSRKLVCRPDSMLAQEMMADVIRAKNRPHALHRLGMAAHVFVDTFAHQGFIGQWHERNHASDVREASGNPIPTATVPPVGHGQVGTCPDQPYLVWTYIDSDGEPVRRNNPEDFIRAADRLCQEFRRFRIGDSQADVPGLPADGREAIRTLLVETRLDDGERRHDVWLQAIADDFFGFGAQTLGYVGKGEGSWKHLALGDGYLRWLDQAKAAVAGSAAPRHGFIGRVGAVIHSVASHAEALAEHVGVEPIHYPYSPRFHQSDYKLFHDAARDQRQAVFAHILPSHGIYAA